MRSGLRSRPWAGIDLGAYSIKLLATLGGVGARHWTAEATLNVAVHERDTPAGREAIAKRVAHCMSQAGLTPRSVRGITVGISGPDVILKQITLPLMDEDEVGQALRFESRKHLPFDPQGMVIDFQILGRSMTEKRMDVLLAAVPQDRLEKQIAPLRLLGIEADIVDAAPLALVNALFHQVSVRAEPQLMLDLGHDSSHLMLYQRSEPFFARRFEFGGRTLTESIARGLKIPFEEAEEWKLAAGSDHPSFAVDWKLPEMGFIFDALRFDLVEELRRSIAFYRTIGKLQEPFTLWLSGGSARLPGLAARLHELLECPVVVFNPMTSIDGAGAAAPIAPQFAQALGLALRNG